PLTRLGLFGRSRYRVSQQDDWPDGDEHNHPEGNQLGQVIRLCPVGISITEEARSANAQRVCSFHRHVSVDTRRTFAFQRKGNVPVTFVVSSLESRDTAPATRSDSTKARRASE